MSARPKDKFFVLVVDDSEDDRFLLKESLRRTTRLEVINEVCDGREAISYFQGHADYSNRKKFPLPDLLLLDLQMPFKNGFEVLEWLSAHPPDNLTVVVLTDSMQPEHIKRALDLGADLFQVKPVIRREREAMVLALEDYLVNNNTLTPAHAVLRHK
ncbi:MAG TPA: response regulator [Verrucomicrobiae bacterium]|jgi:CheY-like chemotaxis protein|nr:response regulator [Verrucomicrobiae bacterium]